ncbi:glycogen/starch synthase [Candidatus Woesearchaeota archaeon]|nr:glycogen/starch synthase [Candidatus Woesearchaeota archaeon]
MNFEDIIKHHQHNQHSTKLALAATEIKYLPKEIDPLGIVNTGSGGGLSRIMATLGEATYAAGFDTKFIIPEYYDLFRKNSPNMTDKEFAEAFNELAMHPSVHFVDDGLFTNATKVYGDYSYNLNKIDTRRAIHFSKGIVRASRQINRTYPKATKIFQLNEWSTALAVAPIKEYDIFGKTKVEMKYHNFHSEISPLFKVTKQGFNTQKYYEKLFYENSFPSGNHGKDMYELYVNFLLSGMFPADLISTVSVQYLNEGIARAISDNWNLINDYPVLKQIKDQMDAGVLQPDSVMSGKMAWMIADKFIHGRAKAVSNRLESTSNSEIDPNLPEEFRYGTENMLEGKNKAKLHLQQISGLEVGLEHGLGGWANRFNFDDVQKGLKQYFPVLYKFLKNNPSMQQIFTCDIHPNSQKDFDDFRRALPGQVGHLTFSNANESLMMAAVDRIDLPSVYEPGGYPNKTGTIYGGLPMVRNTGGLAETIDYTMNPNTFTGFKFNNLDEGGIMYGLNSFKHFFEQGPDFRFNHLRRIREKALIDENPARLVEDYIPIWEEMIGEKIILRD